MLRKRLTYANVMATLALFVALGGTSVAAVTLKRNAVKNRHIATGAVTSPKVKDKSLRARDFAPGQLPQGERGPPGPSTGPAGGDLSGSYPNPAIASGAVTAGKLGNGSVTAGKLGPVVVRTALATVPTGAGGNASGNAQCAAGEKAVGGGASLSAFVSEVLLISSRPADSASFFELPANGTAFDSWRATALRPATGGSTVSVRAHVLCLQP